MLIFLCVHTHNACFSVMFLFTGVLLKIHLTVHSRRVSPCLVSWFKHVYEILCLFLFQMLHLCFTDLLQYVLTLWRLVYYIVFYFYPEEVEKITI